MGRSSRLGAGILGVLTLVLACVPVARGQERDVAFDAVRGQPRGLPDLPPQGAWGEVINATSRWIVIQNHQGQQFPVAVDDIQEFLVRWPYSLRELNEQSVIEVAGQDVGSNVVRVNHIDAFEGANRTLVAPAYNQILPSNMVVTTLDPGFNRFMNAWDYAGQNLLYGWAYPVPPNLTGIPNRLHVVGNVIGKLEGPQGFQIRVGLPGNNFSTVIPDESGRMTITEITRGDAQVVKKGDYAFLLPMPNGVTPRGLVLSQLVLYKQVPRAQFNPNR
ncbi:MAG: hypothetical protein U0790_22775 [Isosphaeraceae bacterium]